MSQVKITSDSAAPLSDEMIRAIEHADGLVMKDLARLKEGFDFGSEWIVNEGQARVRLVAVGDTPTVVSSEPIPVTVLENDEAFKQAFDPTFVQFARALLEASRLQHRKRWGELRREWELLQAEVAVEA